MALATSQEDYHKAVKDEAELRALAEDLLEIAEAQLAGMSPAERARIIEDIHAAAEQLRARR